MKSPQCVAVDAEDNFYVTDSETGRIFVFEAGGKFKRIIGNLKGGEGYFKRPTGIAVDSAAQRIYVTDTLRNKVYVLDMNGSVMQTIGKPGTANGEFNFPTEIVLHGQDLAVVDAMKFPRAGVRSQRRFKYAVGKVGDGEDMGSFFRPKGIGFDSEGHLYVVDGAWSRVQVFDQQGELLYYFGARGGQPGAFNLPAGCLSITTTASTSRIPTTAACKSFSTTGNGSRAGASRNEVLDCICGLPAECKLPASAVFRGCAGNA